MKVVIFLVLAFGWPVYWGATHKSSLGVALWAIGLAIFAVSTGWRHPDNGPIKSGAIGAVFALVACGIAYFGAYWIWS